MRAAEQISVICSAGFLAQLLIADRREREGAKPRTNREAIQRADCFAHPSRLRAFAFSSFGSVRVSVLRLKSDLQNAPAVVDAATAISTMLGSEVPPSNEPS